MTVARGEVHGGAHVAIPLPPDRTGHFRVVVRGADGWADGISETVVGR